MDIVELLGGTLLTALGLALFMRRRMIRKLMDRMDFSAARWLATRFNKDVWNYEGRVREVQFALPGLLVLMGLLLILAALL